MTCESGAGIVGLLRRFGYSWGETEEERARRYPCDDLICDPEQSAYRAIDVDAPAPLVWRWLCQLRVAPYSYDWIDNWGRRSPRELTPGLDEVALGQRAVAFFEIPGWMSENRSEPQISSRSTSGVHRSPIASAPIAMGQYSP